MTFVILSLALVVFHVCLKLMQMLCLFLVSPLVFNFGGAIRVLLVKLDFKHVDCEFNAGARNGSLLKLRKFCLPYFASVYSAPSEYWC